MRYVQLVALATVLSDCDVGGGSEDHSRVPGGQRGRGTKEGECNVSIPFMSIFRMMTRLRDYVVN